MGLKNWVISEADKAAAHELSRECDIDSFCAFLLTVRNITDPTDAEEFLSSEDIMADPTAFADMDKAVERIRAAIENEEKIAIFGDYDCDGITSTAVLYTHLVNSGANVIYRLPSRDDGYGISKAAIDELNLQSIKLIITVDNGISAFDEIEYANSLHIDTVITDHHIPPQKLPNAVAVVDPKREDDFCEFKDYAGVGVAFMLVCALENASCEELLPEYADLVALGTIADVMPVLHDNRTIIKYGLKQIKQHKRGSVAALIEAAGMSEREVNSTLVSFGLAPRLNAAGRMLDPCCALELLLCDEKAQAAPLARDLNDLNLQRQKLESDIMAKAELELFSNEQSLKYPVLVIYGENWHHGVLGLIAAKMCRKYCRPCVALSVDDGRATGSARSIGGVSIYDLIAGCADLLLGFGGHPGAAGLQLKAENIDDFIARINLVAHEKYPLIPFETLSICCKLNPKTLSVAHAYSQKQLEPFGQCNEQPVFGLYKMRIISVSAVGKGNHLKITVARDNNQFTVMKFFTHQEDFPYVCGDIVDLAVTLDVNRFADEESLSVIVSDIKPSDVDNDYLTKRIRAYENFCVFNEIPDCDAPTREDIAAIYKKLRSVGHILAPCDTLMHIFGADDYFKLCIILDILSEADLIKLTRREFIEIEVLQATEKVDLTKMPTYCKINRK